MQNIHEKISIKGKLEDFERFYNNAHSSLNGIEKLIFNKSLVHIVLEGVIAYNKELSTSQYYCYECKCYHRKEYPFLDFKEKWKRYAKQLQEIHDFIF